MSRKAVIERIAQKAFMGAREVNSWKASQISGEEVRGLVLRFVDPVPEVDRSEDEARLCYGEEARRIAAAMFASLPGGLIDALIGQLFARRASLLLRPHWRAETFEEFVEHEGLGLEDFEPQPRPEDQY